MNVYKTITVMITADKSRAVKPVMSDNVGDFGDDILLTVVKWSQRWSSMGNIPSLIYGYTIPLRFYSVITSLYMVAFCQGLRGPGQLRRASVGPK